MIEKVMLNRTRSWWHRPKDEGLDFWIIGPVFIVVRRVKRARRLK